MLIKQPINHHLTSFSTDVYVLPELKQPPDAETSLAVVNVTAASKDGSV